MNGSEQRYAIYEFGGVRLDPRRRLLSRVDGEPIAVTAKVFDALLYLVEHAGEPVPRSALIEALWPTTVVEDGNLNQTIWAVRRALGDDQNRQRYVVTLPGRGYQFVADVRTLSGAPPDDAAEAPVVMVRTNADSRSGLVAEDTGLPHEQMSPNHRPLRRNLTLTLVVLVLGAASYALFHRSEDVPEAEQSAILQDPAAASTVAVLPFRNESADPDGDLLGESLGDDLRDGLARLPGSPLRVTHRDSSNALREQSADPQSIANRLGVAVLVRGSVRGRVDDLSASVEVIDGRTGRTIWTHDYPIGRQDLLSVEQEIASQVAANLVPDGHSTAAAATPKVAAVSAHTLIARGRFFEQQVRDQLVVDKDKLLQAISLYRRATEADQTSALAYSRLAAALLYLGDVAAAEAPLMRAIELDPNLSDTHYTLALYRMRRGLPGIREAYEKAIALDPNNADALGAYGQWVWGHDELVDAEQYFVRALRIDPLTPSRWLDYVEYLGGSNRKDDVLRLKGRILSSVPNAPGYLILARLYELTGDLDLGIAWALKAYELQPHDSDTAGQLAELYARIGDFESASLYEPQAGIGQLFLRRHYDELIQLTDRLMIDGTDDVNVQYMAAFAYNATKQFRYAVRLLKSVGIPETALRDSNTPAEMQALMTYTDALQATGDGAARELAEQVVAIQQRRVGTPTGDAWWPNTYLACAQANLGRIPEALDALDRIKNKSVGLAWSPLLIDSPCFQGLARQPRYRALLADLDARQARLRDRLPATLEKHGLSLRTSATP